MKKNIAFLGLGAMGSRMARRLTEGHVVTVWNRSSGALRTLQNAGARVADTPRQAVQNADIVISMVTDDDASARVWLDEVDGAVLGLRPGSIALECSTVRPVWIKQLAGAVQRRGASLLDAPVAGSTPQAEAGELAFLVGGDAADVDSVTPVIELMGSKLLHAGPLGHGAVLKLAVNSLFATQVALMAELLHGASNVGLDPAHVLSALSTMPVTSPAAAAMGGLMVAGDHEPRFPVDLAAKDLRYAAEVFTDTPVVDAARGQLEAASARGLGSRNLTAVYSR